MKPFRLEQIRKEQWILLLLVGILIMTAVFPSGKERESMAGSTTESESQSSPQEEADLEELTWYEKRLEAILAQMDGAGKVQVMITESVSRESIVEKDQIVQRQMNQDGDDSTNTGKSQQENKEESTVLEKDGQGRETPYVTRTNAPKIEGVLILAQGGDNAVVVKNITEAAMALFGIEAHKIKVIKMI